MVIGTLLILLITDLLNFLIYRFYQFFSSSGRNGIIGLPTVTYIADLTINYSYHSDVNKLRIMLVQWFCWYSDITDLLVLLVLLILAALFIWLTLYIYMAGYLVKTDITNLL